MSLKIIYDKSRNEFRYSTGARTDDYIAAMIAAEQNDTEMLNVVKQYYIDNKYDLTPYYRCVFINAAGGGHLSLVQKTASSFEPSPDNYTDAVIEAMIGTRNMQVINWLLKTGTFYTYHTKKIRRCAQMKGIALS